MGDFSACQEAEKLHNSLLDCRMELMIQKMGLMTMRMIMFIMLYCYPLLCFICSTVSNARGQSIAASIWKPSPSFPKEKS